ncbi:MAG TPA: hypothetical protein VHD38_01325 [Candidatus Paceibacterota bacterium]|jgi:hypothetical protein|nr:hypothetical protein [Candidatus Paceibacterota bacterium]
MQAPPTEEEPIKHNVIVSAALQLQGKLFPPKERAQESPDDDEPDFFDTMSCFA